MICRPMVAEQQVNGRCVSEVWGLGLDMNCSCDRSVVEKVARALMEREKERISRSTAQMARDARDSASEGGASYENLHKLISDIKILHSK